MSYRQGFASQDPVRSHGRKKPIKSLTAYNYVVKYDVGRKLKVTNRGAHSIPGFFASPIREESYNVMKGELLFQSRNSRDYHDGVHVFSFANGLGVDWSRAKKKVVKQLADGASGTEKLAVRTYMNYHLLDNLQFVGIALTDFNAEGNNYQNVMQGFVATIGGVCTITNTGSSAICPGQWVMYSAPSHNSYDRDGEADNLRRNQGPGVPLDKQLFETVPYKFDEIMKIASDIRRIDARVGINTRAERAADRSVVTVSDLRRKDTSVRLGSHECAVLEHMSNRIIGKALSYARPGECFDILLGGRPLFFMGAGAARGIEYDRFSEEEEEASAAERLRRKGGGAASKSSEVL